MWRAFNYEAFLGIQGAQPSLLPLWRWSRFLAGTPGFAGPCASFAGVFWIGLQNARLLHGSFSFCFTAGVRACVGLALLSAGLCLLLLPCRAMDSSFSAWPRSLWTSCLVPNRMLACMRTLQCLDCAIVLASVCFAAACDRSHCLSTIAVVCLSESSALRVCPLSSCIHVRHFIDCF